VTRLAHLLKELAKNTRRNPGTAITSLLSLSLLYLLFDLFWIAAGTSDGFYHDLLSEMKVEVYLSEDISDSSVVLITETVSALEGVREANYVSRDEARIRLSEMVGADLLAGYDESNPLPRSILVSVEKNWLNSRDMDALQSELESVVPGSDISYSRTWLSKAEETRSIILQVGLGLGILIFVTALISSANNIRLMTRTRAVGFRQMLLLGTGKLTLALPFLIEGFLLSGAAAATGWVALHIARSKVQLSQIEVVFPTIEETIIYCAVVATLGLLSGYFGVRRFLKV